ncbi:calcium-binding protein [Lichenifustis flavocetrariae]|uniref:Calcium-binding protein n=1 Tax=Lichenifustis flavocetrariae TaxID=2949735 RepID=A0AA41YSU7_9HYPH|nr:calcium-binding protein [Lichenifustis flavocetrariae]MCW6507524.1 hypothetical protein [Lichenifustis flavocetrariae]
MTTFSTSWTNAAAAGSSADMILQSLQTACNSWAPFIQSSANITVSITIGDVGNAIATGGSTFYRNAAGLYDPVAVDKIETGNDPNGLSPDINVTLSPTYVNQLFYDPGLNGHVPSSQLDAVSVFEHEIGHGLGILDVATSSYGQFVTNVGGQPYFSGTNAQAAYGGPVPLDSSVSHVEVNNDLMYPSIPPGTRRTIGDIDLGILQDVGMPIATDRSDHITLGSADNSFAGEGGDDTIVAGIGPNTLSGGQGNDSLVAGDGNNLLFGNEGNDTIQSGNGDSTLVGGRDSTDGADRILAGSGRDLIFGNGGDDTVMAGGGADSVIGGFGNDQLLGNQGNDLILGNQGQDIIYGGQGNDTIFGGQGNDILFGNEGDDLLFGNEGSNTFVFARGDTDFQSGVGTGDTIADFKTGSDRVVMTQGPAATAQNFGTTSVLSADFAGIQAAAQTLVNGGDAYAFVTDGTNGYLFADENSDKAIDDAIRFNGASSPSFLSAGDIAVGAVG